jgi:hypothetical protein
VVQSIVHPSQLHFLPLLIHSLPIFTSFSYPPQPVTTLPLPPTYLPRCNP